MKKGDIIIIVVGLLLMLGIFVVYQLINYRAGSERYVSIRYKQEEIHRVELKEGIDIEVLIINGEYIETIDRNKEPDRSFEINEEGYNIVKIHNNGVQVIEADCASQDDVVKGFTEKIYDSIICAPHFLEIQIRPIKGAQDDVDANV